MHALNLSSFNAGEKKSKRTKTLLLQHHKQTESEQKIYDGNFCFEQKKI